MTIFPTSKRDKKIFLIAFIIWFVTAIPSFPSLPERMMALNSNILVSIVLLLISILLNIAIVMIGLRILLWIGEKVGLVKQTAKK